MTLAARLVGDSRMVQRPFCAQRACGLLRQSLPLPRQGSACGPHNCLATQGEGQGMPTPQLSPPTSSSRSPGSKLTSCLWDMKAHAAW